MNSDTTVESVGVLSGVAAPLPVDGDLDGDLDGGGCNEHAFKGRSLTARTSSP